MPKCVIDGREAEFTPGENLIEVAKRVGVEIPVFCYHPALTVVAQCRMCYVEVEKMPKLQTACSTPAADGMIVKTQSERVLKGRKATMEFLLLNHPLDCPICDESGECDLQDNSYGHGDAQSRFTEEKRTYVDLDMGPVIKKNMNRCIHCTRCIRYGDEIAGIREMVAIQRGNNTEITTIDGNPLETEYAGNYADICPTGSLTIKDFRFKKRVWFLKKTDTVCEGCSKGCNMVLHQEGNTLYRSTPRENKEINKYWLCDEGRFNFRYVNAETRIIEPRTQSQGELRSASPREAVEAARTLLAGRKTLILVGSDLTQEEGRIILEFSGAYLPGAPVQHFGTPGVRTTKDDAPADKILKRTGKTANLFGLEKLGIQPFSGSVGSFDSVLIFRGGRAPLPDTGKALTVGVGVFHEKEAANFAVVLPGLSWAEKDGTLFNFEGREQKIKRAILPVGGSRPLGEILALWANSKGGR